MGQTWMVNSVDEFPDWPPYAVWAEPFMRTDYRGAPRQESGWFTCYDSLSQCKAAITNDAKYKLVNGRTTRSYRVYERYKKKWVEVYHLPDGTVKERHELWAKGVAPKVAQAVDDEDIQAAIASIIGDG